jgi:hypothetical protein
VTVPFARIPSENSEVPVVTGTVPVPVAGPSNERVEPEEFEELEELDALFDDDEVEALEPPLSVWSAACTAEVRASLVRFKAVWLARLASPLDSVLDAPNIALMVAVLVDWVWLLCCAWAQ